VAAYRLGAVGRGGALGGLAVGTVIYASLGWRGFAVLALFVAGGSALTRLGYAEKLRQGGAEAWSGRRGAANALANCSIAVLCALGAALTPYTEILAAAFVAALGAAFADTAESEVGQLYRRSPRLVTNLRKVPPGTDGAVSAPGTLAGVAAAGATALLALLLGLVGEGAAILVWVAAFLGTVADSLVGALASRVGNELTNVICTLVAAAFTLWILG
jgi:uncharacterized protein (TIGR00297 family)